MKNTAKLIFIAVFFAAMAFAFTACSGDSFTDPRDGQKYKTVKIGDRVWMAEKLKYKGNADYTWDSALVACPDGWHLPSRTELEGVIADTNFDDIWSSTEVEDFTLSAYVKISTEIKTDLKNRDYEVRCVKGGGILQKYLGKINNYDVIRIGDQFWMENNLDIKTPNSICFLDDESECSHGRFYPFSEAITVCPNGWHLPSKAEAAKLINKLMKYNGEIKSTHGYYQGKEEKFSDFWGDVILWTSTYPYLIQHRTIWDGKYHIKSEDWKVAVRCIADSENTKE